MLARLDSDRAFEQGRDSAAVAVGKVFKSLKVVDHRLLLSAFTKEWAHAEAEKKWSGMGSARSRRGCEA